MIHPLASEWSFYGFSKPEEGDSELDYEKQIKLLARFETVEDFWKIYSHIIRPSQLQNFEALHLFREKTRAMREDPEHQEGGSFLIRVSKGLGPYYWEQLALSLISEKLPKDVLGIIISARPKFFNIFVWHKTAANPELRMEICTKFCALLKLPVGLRIDYTAHNSVLHIDESGKQTAHYILEENGPVSTVLPARPPSNPAVPFQNNNNANANTSNVQPVHSIVNSE